MQLQGTILRHLRTKGKKTMGNDVMGTSESTFYQQRTTIKDWVTWKVMTANIRHRCDPEKKNAE